jgi:hypothetical protein
MPLAIPAQYPSLLIRKPAFERVGLTRREIDERLSLTDQEFQVEGDLILIGPIHAHHDLEGLIAELERAGLEHFEDFFDLSGTWPGWLHLFAMSQHPRSPADPA